MNENATTQTTTTLTKEQELLRACRSSEDLTEFIARIPDDEEYMAWKAAHPERDSKWQNMTKEQKKEYLADLIMQLAEKEQQRQHEQLRKILRSHNMPTGEIWYTIREYCHREKDHPEFKDAANNEMMLLLDMFEYGRICGIRQERARKRGALQ